MKLKKRNGTRAAEYRVKQNQETDRLWKRQEPKINKKKH